MPGQFLTAVERERLASFPPQIPPEDVGVYFTLSERDLGLVRERRGDQNRLCFSLQLGALRYLGFSPDDLSTAPADVVSYLARQVDADPDALSFYASRDHTRTSHLQEIEAHLGFRHPTPEDLEELSDWVLERALEHDKATLLFGLAAQKLLAAKIVRPGVTVLERLVASARDRTGPETYHRLEPLLIPELRNVLDGLLVADGTRKGTQLSWLRQGTDENSAKAVLAEISKLERLREWGADGWDMAGLSHNRLKFLAQLGARSTNQALARAPEERRYPILLAFLRQTQEEITDEVIEIFDLILADFYRRAGNDLESLRKGAARATNELVRHFNIIGRILLDPGIPDDPRTAV
ncbi:MAG: DUF4158 domain-containing protein [Chloroflexota bacterium]|nr:DUF4158 domain-containing protein [Chloroflexota bacterium]